MTFIQVLFLRLLNLWSYSCIRFIEKFQNGLMIANVPMDLVKVLIK
jgi:hypothetical protein